MARMASNHLKPWERQTGERGDAFAAFCVYRDMAVEERSIRKCGWRMYGKTNLERGLYDNGKMINPADVLKTRAGRDAPGRVKLGRWSSKYGWPDRVRAWDSECDRHRRIAHLHVVRRMAKRHAEMAAAFHDMLQIPVQVLKRKLGDKGSREQIYNHLAKQDTWAVLKKLIDCAYVLPMIQKAERKALGVDEIAEGDLVTVEDLRGLQDSLIGIVAEAIPAEKRERVASEMAEVFNRIGSKELTQ